MFLMENPVGLELEISKSVNPGEAQAARTLSLSAENCILIGTLLLLKIPCTASSEKIILRPLSSLYLHMFRRQLDEL